MRVLALDLGGTKTTAGVVELTAGSSPQAARVECRRTLPTPAQQGAAAVLENALGLAEAVLAETVLAEAGPVSAIGIASAGVVDPHRGVVTHATDALPGWAGTDLVAAFTARFGLPAVALNDVQAHGLGEALFGAGAGHSSMLLAAIGTGIGGCLVVEGAPLFGARSAAGHLGHVAVPGAQDVVCSCGRTGHLEGLASGPGIHASHLRRGGTSRDTREVAALALAGDPLAREVLHQCGFATGQVLGGLMNVLDPDVVVLTGGVVGIGEPWLASVRAGVAHDAMDVVAATPLVTASAGVEAALLGAAAHARAGQNNNDEEGSLR